jgi:Fur family peroxide stress response transcriptional regulator
MNDSIVLQRKTKYCTAIEAVLAKVGHASNAELLTELKKLYPDVSATTVHRATARLSVRGAISHAPATHDGSMRYDFNTTPHDHFLCTICGILKDTDIKDKIIPLLESSIEDCSISGRLTISGICKTCKRKNLE